MYSSPKLQVSLFIHYLKSNLGGQAQDPVPFPNKLYKYFIASLRTVIIFSKRENKLKIISHYHIEKISHSSHALMRNLKLKLNQCFGSIFIESGSGSSQKSQSGSRKALNPDPDPCYFFTLFEKKLFIIKRCQLKEGML